MNISILNYQHKLPIPQAQIKKAVVKSTQSLKLRLEELSIVFVGEQRMRSINRKFLKHDYVTDVLTFDLGQGMAEIVICPSVAMQNAKQNGLSLNKELILYVIHGLLHLAGHDDHEPGDIARMRQYEQKLLSRLFK